MNTKILSVTLGSLVGLAFAVALLCSCTPKPAPTGGICPNFVCVDDGE